MTDELFADQGPEGRNAHAREFEERLSRGLTRTLRWDVVAASADVWLPSSHRSRGYDGIWAIPNPRTGRGDGWVAEAKRHDGPGRYSRELLRSEVQSVRDKAVLLQKHKFLRDSQIAPHIQDVAGGLLLHHCRGFPRTKVRDLLGDLPLRGLAEGPQPPRVLLIGPDDLNGFGEAVCRYGAPVEYWWPPGTDAVAAWTPHCPPEQLAAGVVFFRTEEHGTVLLLRDELERRDLEAVCDLAFRFGRDIDVVACAALRPETLPTLSATWSDVRRMGAQRDRGRLPDRIDALETTVDSMAAFDRAWTVDGPALAAASTRRSRREPRAAIVTLPAATRRRRRPLTAYPSAVAVQRTISQKASLAGARSFLASEGIVVFADGKPGAALAAGTTWFAPGAYRRMGDQLETGGQPTVTGLRIRRADGQPPTLSDLGRGTVFEELTAAAQKIRGVEAGPRKVRLVGSETGDGTWPLTFALIYEDVYDLLGGERIARDAHTQLLIRPVDDEEVDICLVTDEPSDRLAARQWLNCAFDASVRGWQLLEVALPWSDDARVEALTEVIDATSGAGLLGVASPDQHREPNDRSVPHDGDPAPGDDAYEAEFVSRLRGARYETDLVSIDAVLARSRRNRTRVGELTAYRQLPTGTHASVIAIRARQGPSDAFLSLAWKGGNRHTERTIDQPFTIDTWAEMRPLGWSREQKNEYLIDRWAKAVDTLRRRERNALEQLSRTA